MKHEGPLNQIELLNEMRRLLEAAEAEQLRLRLIGGLAVLVHSPHAEQGGFRRDYPDMDFVIPRRERRRMERFFVRMGYQPDRRFNLLNGDRRQVFYDSAGRRVDVFVGDFEMCHRLPMRRERLEVHPMTVPLAELFLSKIQIVELNRKDALDLISLLLDNDVGFDDDAINLRRIARLCLRSWGLYKTMTINLGRIEQILLTENLGLSQEQVEMVLGRINTIRRVMSRARKPVFWKMRDRLGTRLKWYADVEEVER